MQHLTTYLNVSRWYSLGWDTRGPALILRIQSEFARRVKKIPDDSHFVLGLKEHFGLGGFSGDLRGQFGFEGVFTREDPDNGFICFKVPFPVLNKEGGRCKYCGDGTDTEVCDCTACMGTGKKWSMDHHHAHAIVASLHAFLECMGSASIETHDPNPQLMEVFTSLGDGCYDLRGTFSKPLRGYLGTLSTGTRIACVEQAMIRSYSQLFGSLRPYASDHFRASVDHPEGWLNISCPGLDSSRISPFRDSFESSVAQAGEYAFVSDGVNTPCHQLVLLSALGALQDFADPLWREATRNPMEREEVM